MSDPIPNPKTTECAPEYTFKALYLAEQETLEKWRDEEPCRDDKKNLSGADYDRPITSVISKPGPAGEPWVVFTEKDCVGLALSGGGIRSATFNLGLLQGLHQQKVLEHVDYVSTVSGGGYIGGFWTAWRARSKGAKGAFPVADDFAHLEKLLTALEGGVRDPDMLGALVDCLTVLRARVKGEPNGQLERNHGAWLEEMMTA